MEGDLQALAQYAIRTILFAALPILLTSLIVGLFVSIVQAVTQIQEATLSFVPKIISVFVSMLLFGPWILETVMGFATNIFRNLNIYMR